MKAWANQRSCIVLQYEGQLVAIEATDEIADDVIFKSELQRRKVSKRRWLSA